MPDAPMWVMINDLNKLFDRVLSVSDHHRRHALGGGHNFTIDHQDPVIFSRNKVFNDYTSVVVLSSLKSAFRRFFITNIDRNSFAVVAVNRLEDNRKTEIPDCLPRLLPIVNY